MQETITYLKLSYIDLALRMFLPEMVLRDAVEGKMGLTLGQWIRLGKVLGLPTTYELRPGERDDMPRWEVCFPPVHVPMDKAKIDTRSISEAILNAITVKPRPASSVASFKSLLDKLPAAKKTKAPQTK